MLRVGESIIVLKKKVKGLEGLIKYQLSHDQLRIRTVQQNIYDDDNNITQGGTDVMLT